MDKLRRDEAACPSDLSVSLAARPMVRPGATTRAGNNETSSRPPIDLGGALRYTQALAKRRYRRSYVAGAIGSLIYPRSRGAWQIRLE